MSVRAGRRRRGRPSLAQRRARLALALLGCAIVVAVIVSAVGGGGVPKPPPPVPARAPSATNPFGYVPSQQAEFVARATAGNGHVLFTKSPGGALATAARVATYRARIDRVTRGTGIDPNLVEALVFVESAGRPDAIAGSDPASAAGLTQILASTGQSLLGMHIDLPRSRRLTARIDAAAAALRLGRMRRLEAQRAAVDDRFDPARALAATVRYLQLSERQFGDREDLAVESYHMGVGNLHTVLDSYDGGRIVPYAQLYFDSAPDVHAATYRLLAGFGDDSSLYLWRVLGAAQIMRLYRRDRPALERLASLQTADDAGSWVLHPPGRPGRFTAPAQVSTAYARRRLVPLPSNGGALGLAYDASMGAGARRVGASVSLYRGLTPVALRLLIELAGRVRALAHSRAPLHLRTTVSDARYQASQGIVDAIATTGDSFTIDRRYGSAAQASAFQAVLDRLQSLNLIAWSRAADTIEVTVASDAMSWLRR